MLPAMEMRELRGHEPVTLIAPLRPNLLNSTRTKSGIVLMQLTNPCGPVTTIADPSPMVPLVKETMARSGWLPGPK